MLLINNQPTAYLFCNKHLVKIFWTTDESTTFKVNGGSIKTTRKAYVKGYGEVWFNGRSITNIFALKKVKHKFRVKYYSNNDGFFTVKHSSGQDMQFNMHKDGIHYHDTKNCQVTPVQI